MISYRRSDIFERFKQQEESNKLQGINVGSTFVVIFVTGREEGVKIDQPEIKGVFTKYVPPIREKVWDYLKKIYTNPTLGFVVRNSTEGEYMVRPGVGQDRSSGHMEFLKGFQHRSFTSGFTFVSMDLKEFCDAYIH